VLHISPRRESLTPSPAGRAPSPPPRAARPADAADAADADADDDDDDDADDDDVVDDATADPADAAWHLGAPVESDSPPRLYSPGLFPLSPAGGSGSGGGGGGGGEGGGPALRLEDAGLSLTLRPRAVPGAKGSPLPLTGVGQGGAGRIRSPGRPPPRVCVL
jgi:hypothetical protein